MSDLLALIKQQADQYQAVDRARPTTRTGRSSPTEMAVYRMTATGIELLKPVLLWLHDPELDIPADVAERGDRGDRELDHPPPACCA